ncbi:MlaA family lipoprotein [Chitinimonas koreensis]|uniref:MlaA family lipoprotein n=1 Tax=Chitinimonas koreensis TaxID=356302 RepID=UPI00040957AA|nr:VacJ family lipoprotein [Chitinimonas koreensis]QNM96317.1 VacJ family lipoprotein [Chitinimonas koreensis]
MRLSVSLALTLPLLAACATPANHYDPLEPVNRKVYAFNSTVDKAVLKPVAQGYVAVTPKPVRTAVTNFFGNLEDVYIGASNLLQGKWREASTDAGRVLFNSTLGLAGLIDIATPAGLPKHNEDFGQVLGKWGVASGPYLVLPLMGPKTLRDTADTVGGMYVDPKRAIQDQAVKNSLTALDIVDLRARLLGAESVINEARFGDEYSFVRDSYLQRRYSLVWDEHPPEPLQLGEPADEDDEIDVKDIVVPGETAPAAPAADAKPAPAGAAEAAAAPVAPASTVEPAVTGAPPADSSGAVEPATAEPTTPAAAPAVP